MEHERINKLANLVCERLTEKRIAFLWSGAPLFCEPLSGFTWIHYCFHCQAKTASLSRVYDLRKLDNPISEARTFEMLVIPIGSPGVLMEVMSGLTLSPASALIEGALQEKVPVLFEASFLSKWCEVGTEESKERRKVTQKIVDFLTKRGMEFLGLKTAALGAVGCGEVVLSCGGWLSWSEVAPLVKDAKTVFLTGGTKLTPEAADRLLKLNIRTEEV